MREALYSQWDARMQIGAKNTDEAVQLYKFVSEIEKLDKAHKRAKRELRKQQKALEFRNNDLKAYRDWVDNVYKELSETERKYKHMVKACDAYFEENQKLMSINAKLNAERQDQYKRIEYLEMEVQKMKNGEID
ncbi:hypothetical protein [Ligilactobacillus animalis]|uniref:hypothetical protein n=1 Tax=Ligilactobacillus animalis TaxID=1605 RepID=UPI0026DFD44D|nr:hypothetical protein [Ligilactobacillus animalis]MDO5884189.1 hypothetical protein [Ligilactobacillus animalis]